MIICIYIGIISDIVYNTSISVDYNLKVSATIMVIAIKRKLLWMLAVDVCDDDVRVTVAMVSVGKVSVVEFSVIGVSVVEVDISVIGVVGFSSSLGLGDGNISVNILIVI